MGPFTPEPVEQRRDPGPVGRGQPLGVGRELLEEDVGIAHASELAPDPAQLVPRPVDPRRVEDGPEGAQVGTEPSGRDPCLVDTLRIVSDAREVVVGHQAVYPRRDGVLRERDDVGVAGEGARPRRVGRSAGRVAERVRDLARPRRPDGARTFETPDHGPQRGALAGRAQLDLQLTEGDGARAGCGRGHGVVGDLDPHGAVGVGEAEAATVRRHRRHRVERRDPRPGEHEVGGAGGRSSGGPGEGVLVPDETVVVDRDRGLDRPAVVGSEAHAHAGAARGAGRGCRSRWRVARRRPPSSHPGRRRSSGRRAGARPRRPCT